MFPSFTKEFIVPPNWVYRGEGNCNVVISLPKERKILRIRKIHKTTSLLTWLLNWITDILYWYCGSGTIDELRDLTFYKKIIRPLIGSNFVCNAEQVFLSKKQIKVLEDKLDHQRPEYRKLKSLQYGRAALFDDYAFFPDEFYPFYLSEDTFAIEIKPKQGWLPMNEKIYPKCTFCMNQYIKRERGQTKTLTSYCPLDLFSGEQVKMVKALKALMHNPQNNLKIFKNGQFCYGENSEFLSFQNVISEFFSNGVEDFDSLLHEFCLLLQTCLVSNFDYFEKSNTCNRKLFCEWNKVIQENSIQTKLPKGSVLERILSVQMLDVEGNQYYYKLLGKKKMRDFEYVRKLLKEVTRRDGTCLKCLIMLLGNSETRDFNLKFVPYLISAIAKDCSLMLTFRKVNEIITGDKLGMKNVVSTKYGDFIVNVGVFDLYPKPLSTILKHRKKMLKLMEISTEQ